ncbi:MAG: GNAT family N-acetyltransferase [Proteobacteria bacterium]|nr:GNAT family N-acetyltransferase [Pseudomonadota bacterium]
MGSLTPPAPLTEAHRLESFRSREPQLDDWLRRRALTNEAAGACRTYVVTDGDRVIAFYSFATGAVAHVAATGRARRNMPDPVPVVVLARMAVDLKHERRGLGRAMIRDATLRALGAAEIVGIRALLVHAKSEGARRFYVDACGLSESPLDPMTLMITLADARRALESGT